MFSGAEMVSRFIISDAETRDFARKMLGAYMLMPDERVWGNRTLFQLLHGDWVGAATQARRSTRHRTMPASHGLPFS